MDGRYQNGGSSTANRSGKGGKKTDKGKGPVNKGKEVKYPTK